MTYTRDDAELLHDEGYRPARADEIETGDRCASDSTNDLEYWTAQRVERYTTDGIDSNGNFTRTHGWTRVWCEYESGATLPRSFSDREIIYVLAPPTEAE